MRRLISSIFYILPIILLAQKSNVITLNQDWQFSQVGDTIWYDAVVPGSIQADLIRNGVLPDPFYGTNERELQWVEDEDWEYKKTSKKG